MTELLIRKDVILKHLFYFALALMIRDLIMLQFTHTVEAPLAKFTNYQEVNPWQYRVLLAWVANVIISVTKVEVLSAYSAITLFATWGMLALQEKLLRKYFSPRLAVVLTPLILFPLIWNHIILSDTYSPYDIASICFFSAGVILLIERKLLLFYVVFAVATLNRETCFLLVPVTVALYWEEQRSVLVRVVSIQIIIWTAIKTALHYAFIDNGGYGLFQWQIGHNMRDLSLLLVGKTHILKSLLLPCAGWHLLMWINWKYLTAQLKRLSLIVPLVFGLMFCVGLIIEARIYNEVIPVVVLCSLYPYLLRFFPSELSLTNVRADSMSRRALLLITSSEIR